MKKRIKVLEMYCLLLVVFFTLAGLLIGSIFAAENEDNILIKWNNGIYKINIPSKELFLDQPFMDVDKIKTFEGLPEEITNEQISVFMRFLFSDDKTKTIVLFTTFDETKYPYVSADSDVVKKYDSFFEYICDMNTGKCLPTDYLESAYNAIGDKKRDISFYNLNFMWDSRRNLLYGHDFGRIKSPELAFAFDLNNKSFISKTDLSNVKIPSGAFSPTSDKFIVVEVEKDCDRLKSLLLYDSNNFVFPLKKYDISKWKYKYFDMQKEYIYSVAWSNNEKFLAIRLITGILFLNLDNGEFLHIYKSPYICSPIVLSPSGRYIVFVKWIPNGLEKVLTAIDLNDNNKEIELLRGKDLSLDLNFKILITKKQVH